MVVFDAWAVLAVLNDEPCAGAVLELVEQHGARMSTINLGEVYYQAIRARGPKPAAEALRAVRGLVRVEGPDDDLVLAAARLKARGGVSYADCFAVATARRHEEPLVTGDPEILALDEFDVIDPRR